MADKTPQVQGDPNPSAKANWLDEVKSDAEFNYRRRERDETERLAYEESKRSGKPDPSVVNGK